MNERDEYKGRTVCQECGKIMSGEGTGTFIPKSAARQHHYKGESFSSVAACPDCEPRVHRRMLRQYMRHKKE